MQGIGTGDTFPHVCLLRLHDKVSAIINLGAIRGENHALEFGVDFRCAEGRHIRWHRHAGIVILAVKDGGMSHRAPYPGLPARGAGAEVFLRAVVVDKFKHSAERRLLAPHSHRTGGRHYLVGPPPGSDLRGEVILRSGCLVQHDCQVVCERSFRFLPMRKARLQGFGTDGHSVHEQMIHAESRCHPFGRHHFPRVPDIGKKPARAIRGACMDALYAVRNHGGVRSRNPF